jgi:ABC-type transport system involved in cytochrome c biogenesis permease subunit
MVEMFVPMAGMVMVVALTALLVRLISAGMLNRTIREALRSDPGSVPLLVERLDRHPPWGDALLGIIFLALAAAMLLLGITEPDERDRIEVMRAAIVPIVIGVTVLVYTRWAARRTPGA